VAYDVGTAFITVTASFRGIEAELKKVSKQIADALNKPISDALPAGVKEGAKRAEKESRDAGDRAGESFAGHFADSLDRTLRRGSKALPKVEIGADSSAVDRSLAKVRKDFEGLRKEKLGDTIDAPTAVAAVDDLRARLRKLHDETHDIQLKVDTSQARDEVDAWAAMVTAGGEKASREAQKAADEQSRIHQQAIDEDLRRDRKAADERSKLHQHALDEDLRRDYLIRQEQGRIHQQAIDDDLKRDYLAFREKGRVHDQALADDLKRDYLARLEMGRQHDLAIKEDFFRGKKASEDARREVDRQAKDAARAAEQAFGQTWAGRIRKGIQDAFKPLPDIGLSPARNQTEQSVKDLRSQLATLGDKRIGVDIDEAAFFAEVARIKAALVDLAKTSPNVQVQADAVAAAADLTAVQRLADHLDGKHVDIKVAADDSAVKRMGQSAQFSLSRLEAMIGAALSLGTVLVPAAAAASSAVGFIGTAAASAAAGIGVMVLGFNGIGTAVKALQGFQDASKKSAVSSAQANKQVASSADSVASAERSLANVRASNADAARQAANSVQNAERGLARAQEDAKRAQLDLTRAREDARRKLQDMQLDLEGISIAQRRANLDLEDAKRNLDKVLADPKSTKQQREQAQLTYDEITLRVKELGLQQQRLAADQKVAAKAGVEGSQQVVAAQEQVRAKQEAVSSAQRQVAEARAAQSAQARQAAFSEVQAQQAVESAARTAEQALRKQQVAGGEALDTLNTAMGKLSPTGQRFAKFIFGLRDEFIGLRNVASNNLLPGVQSSIEGLLPSLPRFSEFVGRVALGIGGMFEQTANFLRLDPTWRKFWGHMDSETVPTLERLLRITENVATGIIGLVLAFSPLNEDFGGGLERFTERFAKWSAQLQTDQGFQKFLAYVQESGPRVAKLLGEMATFVLNFLEASAPVGTLVTGAFTELFSAINSLPIGVLKAIAIAISSITTASLLLSARTRVVNLFKGALDAVGSARENLGKVTGAISDAAEGTGKLSDAAKKTKVAGLGIKDGLATAGEFLTGPWGTAIGVATAALGFFMNKAAEQKQKVDDLASALALLGEAYKKTKSVSSDAVKDIIAQNEELQGLVNNANNYGVAIEDIAKAAAGEGDAQQRVIAALRAKRDALQQADKDASAAGAESGISANLHTEEFNAIGLVIGALETQFDRLNAARAAQEALDAALRRSEKGAVAATEAQRKAAEQLVVNQSRIDALKGVVDAFGNSEATAAQRTDALRKAIEDQTGAAQSSIEAEEKWQSSILGLEQSLTTNGNSLATNTQAGLSNRDALEAAAAAVRERYLADIESNMPMEQANKLHAERIAKLKEEAKNHGLDKVEVDKLVAAYGDIPPNLQTVYTTKGFDQVYKELQALQIAQLALSQGISVDQAANEYAKQRKKGNGFLGAGGLAEGGQVFGPGTATSDSIPTLLSNREFVQPVASVDYYGTDLMEALRLRRIPREMLPGFAKGGLVGWPATVELTGTHIPTMDEVRAAVEGGAGPGFLPWPSSPGAQRGDTGVWKSILGLVRASGIPFKFGNAYRPGDPLWHGSGRAIDFMGYGQDRLAKFFLGRQSQILEMIHRTGSRDYAYTRGHNKGSFNEGLMQAHRNHLHVAMDQGGWLEPGRTIVDNNTGVPEPVLTGGQWDDIARLARNSHAEGRVHQNVFNFRQADLDIGRLRAIEDRQNALARVGRPG
jgi:hypothetical protein